MKIIFSRKGFDDSYGGGASPILPNGDLLSIPIPAKPNEKGIPYRNISYKRKSISILMSELGLAHANGKCHLDPDLVNRTKQKKWKALFGQQAAAAKHLINEGVSIGDLFLFFGTFKRTYINEKGRLQFEKDNPRHIIFGYLQIGDLHDLGATIERTKSKFNWHPHVCNDYGRNNLIFEASDSIAKGISGAGIFKYHRDLVLTREGYRKSIWSLPDFFHPDEGTKISRHLKRERFGKRKDLTILQSVGIGQDFVVHGNEQKMKKWAMGLIRKYKV